MSNSTGTRKERNVQTRANEALTERDVEFINSLKVFAESSNEVAGLAGAAISNSPKTPAGNYLAREGDSMIGPLALGPPPNTVETVVDASNTIDVGQFEENVSYASNIVLEDAQTNSSSLEIIANATFDGQVLILRTSNPTIPYTIAQGTELNGGNIQTSDSNDITMGDNQMIVLVFDESISIPLGSSGLWRVLSGAGGSGVSTGLFISAALSVDQTNDLLVGDHIEFDTNTPPEGADGGIVLQTGSGQANGIFELKANKTYFLSAGINLESGGGNFEFVWFDNTNTEELGVRTVFSSTAIAMNQPKNEIIYTPTTDVEVEVQIMAASAAISDIAVDHTFAHIFEFSGKNGANGADGTDGTDGTNGTNGANGAAGGTGTSISAALSADQTTNIAVNDHIEFDVNTPDAGFDGGIVLQTGVGQLDGIFELKQDVTYYLSGAANAQFSATNHVELVWFDITNGNEIGKRSIQDDTALTIEQSKCEIIFKPTTDVEVELRIVAVTTPGNLTGFESDFTFGNIFEFVDTPGGATGGGMLNAVRILPIFNIPSLNNVPPTQDGKVLAVGNRVLLTEQTTASQNGIYEVTSIGPVVLSRPADFAAGATVGSMSMVSVSDGDRYTGSTWVLTTLDTITINTTGQSWRNILKAPTDIQGSMGLPFAQIDAPGNQLDLREKSGTKSMVPYGNYFGVQNINSSCNGIKADDWQAGSVVILTGNLAGAANTYVHNAPLSVDYAPFFLAGSVNASFTKDDVFMFVFDGVFWREVSRSIAV